MTENHFYDSLGNEMLYYEFAREKLTEKEREALDQFDEKYDTLTTGMDLPADAEGDLIEELFDSIPGSREAFHKFNNLVTEMEIKSKGASKFRSN